MENRMIVNADDFGISEAVNEAICYCFKDQYISNTTIMVNMPFADDAYNLAKNNKFKEHVGLHLNLTEGLPITDDIKTNKDFCDDDGFFNALFHNNLKKRLLLDTNGMRIVEKEIEAQIQKYLEYGFSEMHIDSHHHVHTNFPILRILENLNKKYCFRSIRLSRNINLSSKPLPVVYKKYINMKMKRIFLQTVDRFGDFQDYYLSKYASRRNETVEVMCHPIFASGSGGKLMNAEVDLQFSDFKDLISLKDNYLFISYSEL